MADSDTVKDIISSYNGSNSTNATLDNDDFYRFERGIKIIIPVFFSLIALLGLVGNSLVIIVVVSNKQMRNTTNLLIINLAFADLFFIIICVPFTAIAYVMPVWPLGSILCKVYQYVINVTAYASVYTLVLMSLDRYLAVVHPIQSMTLRTVKNCTLVILISWVIICAVNIPVYLEHDTITYPYGDYENRTKCVFVKAFDDVYYGRLFYGFFFAFAFILPLTLVIILYGAMIKRLLRGVGGSGEVSRGKKRVTKMVISVIVAFTICWIPFHVIQMCNFFGSGNFQTFFFGLQIGATCFAYMNSCINPILYAFLSDNFRKSFRKLLCPDKWEPVRLEFERTCNPNHVALTTTRTAHETVLNNNQNNGV